MGRDADRGYSLLVGADVGRAGAVPRKREVPPVERPPGGVGERPGMTRVSCAAGRRDRC